MKICHLVEVKQFDAEVDSGHSGLFLVVGTLIREAVYVTANSDKYTDDTCHNDKKSNSLTKANRFKGMGETAMYGHGA